MRQNLGATSSGLATSPKNSLTEVKTVIFCEAEDFGGPICLFLKKKKLQFIMRPGTKFLEEKYD